MKKKFVTVLLAATMLLAACGSDAVSSDSVAQSGTVETAPEETSTDDLSQLEDLGNVTVDEGIFDVEMTIPASYVGETTQEELDNTAKEYGYKSITLNDDGSATYVMTKKQHEEMMSEMRSTISDALNAMVGSEDYPNFTDIKANDNFTSFTVTTKSTELDMAESLSVLAFYMYGGMYGIFDGTTVDNVSVTFVNADTGKEITTSNSSDME